MQLSQKSKSRKPIFGKKQKNSQTQTDKLYQTTSSFLQESIPLSQTQSVQINSNLVQSVWQQPVARSNSVAKITIPVNTRTFSPQRIVSQPNKNVLVSRPLTPNIQAIPVYRPPPNIQQQPIIATQFYQTQPRFNRGQGLTKVSSKHPAFQNIGHNEKVIRSNEIRPTVVAVQRVMKQISDNQLPNEPTIFKKNQSPSYVQKIIDPQRIKVFDQVHRKHGLESQKIHKLQEINGILSRNYDVLLDEVQNLKKQQYTQEQSMDENMFIRKAANLFENLLTVEMHKALNEIEEVHKVEKRCASNYRKQLVNSFFR